MNQKIYIYNRYLYFRTFTYMRSIYNFAIFLLGLFSFSFSVFSMDLVGDVANDIGNGFRVVWQWADKTCLFYEGKNTNICMTAAEIQETNKKSEAKWIDVCKDVLDHLKSLNIDSRDCIKGYLVYWTYFFNYERSITKKNKHFFFQVTRGYGDSYSVLYIASANLFARIRGNVPYQVVKDGDYLYIGSANNANRCDYFIEKIHTKTLRVEILYDGAEYCKKNLISTSNEMRFPRFQLLPDKTLILMITENVLKKDTTDPTRMYTNKVRRVIIK